MSGKKIFSRVLTTLFIAAIMLFAIGCGNNSDNSESQDKSVAMTDKSAPNESEEQNRPDQSENIKKFTEEINKNPNDPEAYLRRCLSYIIAEEYELADKDFNKAIELGIESYLPYACRGMIYQELGKYDIAIKDFDKAIELDPNNAEVYEKRAECYCELGNYDKAAEDFTNAGLTTDDEYDGNPIIKYLVNKGESYRFSENLNKAIHCLDKAIEINPNFSKSYDRRGWYYSLSEKYDLALKDFNKAIELDLDNAYAYEDRAECYCELGDYDKAAEDFKIAGVTADEHDYNGSPIIKYLLDSATGASLNGDSDKALKYYDKAVEFSPNSSQPYYWRGNMYHCLKQYDKAIADMNKCIELGHNSVGYLKLGDIYKDMGKYELAIENYRKLINRIEEVGGNADHRYIVIAECYLELGDKEKAREEYKNADLTTDEDIASHYEREAEFYIDVGQHNTNAERYDEKAAVANLSKAIEFSPSDYENISSLYKMRGECYQKLGETEKAEADFQKAKELGWEG